MLVTAQIVDQVKLVVLPIVRIQKFVPLFTHMLFEYIPRLERFFTVQTLKQLQFSFQYIEKLTRINYVVGATQKKVVVMVKMIEKLGTILFEHFLAKQTHSFEFM